MSSQRAFSSARRCGGQASLPATTPCLSSPSWPTDAWSQDASCASHGGVSEGCLLGIRCSWGSKKPKMAFKIVEALRALAGHEFPLVGGNVHSKFPQFSVACVKVWNMASSWTCTCTTTWSMQQSSTTTWWRPTVGRHLYHIYIYIYIYIQIFPQTV